MIILSPFWPQKCKRSWLWWNWAWVNWEPLPHECRWEKFFSVEVTSKDPYITRSKTNLPMPWPQTGYRSRKEHRTMTFISTYLSSKDKSRRQFVVLGQPRRGRVILSGHFVEGVPGVDVMFTRKVVLFDLEVCQLWFCGADEGFVLHCRRVARRALRPCHGVVASRTDVRLRVHRFDSSVQTVFQLLSDLNCHFWSPVILPS